MISKTSYLPLARALEKAKAVSLREQFPIKKGEAYALSEDEIALLHVVISPLTGGFLILDRRDGQTKLRDKIPLSLLGHYDRVCSVAHFQRFALFGKKENDAVVVGFQDGKIPCAVMSWDQRGHDVFLPNAYR